MKVFVFKSADPNWRRLGVAVPHKPTRWFGRRRAAFAYAQRMARFLGCRVEAEDEDLAARFESWLRLGGPAS